VHWLVIGLELWLAGSGTGALRGTVTADSPTLFVRGVVGVAL
jgi:hypothetical protein